ncbi:MAG TPA: ABC transporter ATP-binding protein [Casimicrobiaceae bacterium]|jgi:2-aminoethylphosphonate transport system ATP-binding protein|nr:ABC transporter ATP-binding protein [Casimicrobiaceae bacterium]
MAHPRTAGDSHGIHFDDVSVAYGDQVVLESLSLAVKPGEIVALIGPSGSGKTTALRAVAGFVRPSRGRIAIGARDVTDLPPHARNIGMVVQNYALFPHMRAEDNVAFGLRARGAPAELIRERVPECLRMVGMANYARRYPRELSGGQQQRVAIARALAIRPQVLLLDEPLSALDAQIRRSMLDELARLHRDLPSLTVLYVTHDQTEALTLADHIGIMRDGKLVAFGDAQSLYRNPPNRFAAEFLGRANLLPVRRIATLASGLARVEFADTALQARNHHGLADGSDGLLCVRPHDIGLSPARDGDNVLRGTVRSVLWQGDLQSVELDVGGHVLRLTCAPMHEVPAPGASLDLHFSAVEATLVPETAVDG